MDQFILNLQSPIGLVQVTDVTETPPTEKDAYETWMQQYIRKGMSLTTAFNRFAGCLVTFDRTPVEATKLTVSTGILPIDKLAFAIEGAETADSIQFVDRGLAVTVEQLDEITAYTDAIERLLPDRGVIEQTAVNLSTSEGFDG